MKKANRRALIATLLAGLCASGAVAEGIQRFAVNEYFGVTCDREPASFDVTFERPVPASRIGLRPGPCQVEIIEGTPRAVRKARVWTTVSFRPNTYELAEKDVSDFPALVARINAELAAEGPTMGKMLWRRLRDRLRLPRDARRIAPARPGPEQKAAILRAMNDFLRDRGRYDASLLKSLGLGEELGAEAAKLDDGRPPREIAQKVNRTALELAYGKLIARHRTYPRQAIYTVHTDAGPAGDAALAAPTADAGKIAGVRIATVSNGLISAKVPVGSTAFDPPASPFDVPGPVVSISRDGKEWIGRGYLDSHLRVRSITCQVSRGRVYTESRIHYAFEGGRSYKVRARVYASKPYVQLVEDFDVGGASRFVFNYEDWFADAFFRPEDNRLVQWAPITMDNPCGDFVRIEGQEALARLVVWSQFNYFRGKQETIALKAPDPDALAAKHEADLARYQRDLARHHEQVAEYEKQWDRYEQDKRKYADDLAKYKELLRAHKKDPKNVRKPKQPREPREPRKRTFRRPRPPEKPQYRQIVHTLGGAPIRAASVATPGGDATAVGGFYIRPDRWTRAKVNHVDLYMRPEVPGDRMTRGVVGLKGARQRIAMEAWLVDGHREWAIFAVRAGDRTWLAKAHVLEGVWPLDRIRRLTLVWNSDGGKVTPPDTKPPLVGNAGGPAGSVLLGTRGRSGLQYFNGSNGQIRWRPPTDGFDGEPTQTRPEPGKILDMVRQAATWYMAADDSAYPAVRAMLPWTDREALNPFYQGMENMNFSADLYRYMAGHAVRLLEMGHPEGERMLKESEKRFDMALDRYVYPGSGCWEESHGYAGHTIGVVGPLAMLLKNSGYQYKNFLEDARFARMLEFFLYVHSPIDAEWGNRVVPAVGDHGQSRAGPADRLGRHMMLFSGSKNAEIRRIVTNIAWLVREDGKMLPDGVQPAEKPDLRSRWLRGYGTVMRASGEPMQKMLVLTLGKALSKKLKSNNEFFSDLHLTVPRRADGTWSGHVHGKAPTYNTARHLGTAKVAGVNGTTEFHVELSIGSDRWVKGGRASYVISVKKGEGWTGRFHGRFNDVMRSGKVVGTYLERPAESFLVLRAGQSWGHHHEDKGSMWFWGRNVHFFGDCDWGAPPGGTYWNKYKQGPASGTQIELLGVTNWTLPCKYAAPWISDDEYAPDKGYDYANARCLYPFNPKLDLSRSTPVALRNGYDRQVLFVHPDLLIVRDNVETVCPTIWRMHSFQPKGTTAKGSRATLASPQSITGVLAILYPPQGVKLRTVDRDILNRKYFDADGKPLPFERLPKFKSSVELRWDMPANTPATWTFGVHGADKPAPQVELLDKLGRVTRVRLADGREIIALMDIEPFQYSGGGIDFDGTVGLVVRERGKATVHPIRARLLKAQ